MTVPDPTTSPPVPTRRVVTVRRRRPLRLGTAAVVVGLVLLVIGVLLTTGDQVVQVVAAEGRARIGNPITFASAEREYTITLIPDPVTGEFIEERVDELGCMVEHPDGFNETLAPAKAVVRTSSSIGVFAASFQGHDGGDTTVTCAWERGDMGSSYTVGSSHRNVQLTGIIALVGAVVLLVAGALGITIGIRGRPEMQDITAD